MRKGPRMARVSKHAKPKVGSVVVKKNGHLPAGVKLHRDQSAALKAKLSHDDAYCTAGGRGAVMHVERADHIGV